MTITWRPAAFDYFNGECTLKVFVTHQYATDVHILLLFGMYCFYHCVVGRIKKLLCLVFVKYIQSSVMKL